MRKDPNLGILVSAIFLLAGTYLLHESTARSEWYMDIFMIAGATISAIGLITVGWAIQRHISIRRLEQHVRRHR